MAFALGIYRALGVLVFRAWSLGLIIRIPAVGSKGDDTGVL